MYKVIQGLEVKITNELILRVAENAEEGKRIAEFNEKIHGESINDFILRLYNEHPAKDEILWFYIEELEEEKIVSSMALLPLKWKIKGHDFKVAEMGFVGTDEEYRGQGLFGIINSYFDLAATEREYILSALVGIPHFYRKYEYEFVLSRTNGYSVPTNNIPPEPVEKIKVRKATKDDLDFIEKSYNGTYENYGVSTVFEPDKMQFRYMNNTSDTFYSITYIVEEDRKERGFFTIGSVQDPDRADIILSSKLTNLQMIKVLQFLKTYNMGEINSFVVNISPKTEFARYLESIDSDPIDEWNWQVKINDLKSFFNAFKGILEERIAESVFRGLNRTIKISNYSKSISIEFEEGKITDISVTREYPDRDTDLRITAPVITRLLLSDRSIDEIKHIYNDTIVKDKSKLLVETLFPKKESIPFSYFQ